MVLLPAGFVKRRFSLRPNTRRVYSRRKKLVFLAGKAKLPNLETAPRKILSNGLFALCPRPAHSVRRSGLNIPLRPRFAALGREQKFSLLSASLEQIPLKCSGAVSKEALMSF